MLKICTRSLLKSNMLTDTMSAAAPPSIMRPSMQLPSLFTSVLTVEIRIIISCSSSPSTSGTVWMPQVLNTSTSLWESTISQSTKQRNQLGGANSKKRVNQGLLLPNFGSKNTSSSTTSYMSLRTMKSRTLRATSWSRCLRSRTRMTWPGCFLKKALAASRISTRKRRRRSQRRPASTDSASLLQKLA